MNTKGWNNALLKYGDIEIRKRLNYDKHLAVAEWILELTFPKITEENIDQFSKTLLGLIENLEKVKNKNETQQLNIDIWKFLYYLNNSLFKESQRRKEIYKTTIERLIRDGVIKNDK